MTRLEVAVDLDVCMGAAYCSGLVPRVFTHDATGVVALVGVPEETETTDVPPDLEDAVRNAAASCPSAAITVNEVAE